MHEPKLEQNNPFINDSNLPESINQTLKTSSYTNLTSNLNEPASQKKH